MSNMIHGHEVMKMMLESGKEYTRASLEKEVTDRFGKDVRFYTCSAENMTAEELIDFLEARGKFVDLDKGFTTDPGQICDH